MKISRRKFVQLSSVSLAGIPLSKVTAQQAWYQAPVSENAENELFNAFKNPVGTAKPYVRWWWNGLRVVKKELIRELDMLKAAGIGGVEINSIRFPETADPLNYSEAEWLSDEWLNLLDFAVDAAKERGLVCDIIMGSGWPFGGEFLPKDEQTQIMALGTRDVQGPQTLTIKRAELLDAVEPPIASKNKKKFKELSVLRLAPAVLDNIGSTINLDGEVNNETITVNVPSGKHVLYFLVKITGFMAVMQGAPGASGPVLNHYNKEAVRKYLNRMSDAIRPRLGVLGKKFRSVFTDSLELEGANWCDDMFDQFARRRGYDLKPYLPYILFKTGRLGRALPEKYGSEIGPALQDPIDRVRYDFEITKMELFQERFLDTFLDWCKENQVLSRVQAYGREYHPSDSSMQVDIPECETWIRSHIGEDPKEMDFRHGRSYSEVNKFVSSGARLAGKELVSCEEITNTDLVFNASLERVKITGDQSNLSGVNHSIFHGFNYSPPEAPFPGWIRYGTFFNERNPWWPYWTTWVNYKARLSAVFQKGELVSDIAVMHPLPDLWSKYAAQWDPFPERAYPEYVHNIWEAIHQNGSSCDYVSEFILQHATFPGGNLAYGARKYKVLLVVEAETIDPKTAEALSRFADAGGKIIFIGKEPWKAPGLNNHKVRDKQVADIITAARKKHASTMTIYPAPGKTETMIGWYKGLQKRYQIEPHFQTDNPQPSVSQVYYRYKDSDAFFFSNYNRTDRFAFNADFNIKGKTAWLWNPETGERFLYPVNGANNKLHITLGPSESKLIVFDKASKGPTYTALSPSKKAALTISAPWNVALNHVNGSKQSIVLNELVDFKDHDVLKSFAGVAVFDNSFSVKDASKVKYLDLGKVEGVSEVTVNGKNVGFRWYGDHVYLIDDVVKNGVNRVSVKLTTTLGNYMGSMPDSKDGKKWVRDKKQKPYSVGLIGPVQIS